MKSHFISDCLTHWTGKDEQGYENLKSILLTHQLWLNRCPHFRPCDWKEANLKMVCFTDIPLHLSQEHCGIYGKFAIAFKKSNFIKYGANPVTSHWYQRIDTNMSWHDAKSYAESLGGHLAIVTSQNENDFLWNNLAKDTGAFIWLGGTDKNLFT